MQHLSGTEVENEKKEKGTKRRMETGRGKEEKNEKM